jgi:hypothetical protein
VVTIRKPGQGIQWIDETSGHNLHEVVEISMDDMRKLESEQNAKSKTQII